VSLTPAQLEDFVEALAATPERWEPHVRHDCSDRVYEMIWADDEVSAWVICWSEDHDTGFHDHDRSAAAITVIQGAILEERLHLTGPPAGHVHCAGDTLSVPPTAIHRVLHAGIGLAITIHAYSPPLTATGAYTITPDGRLEREALDGEDELRGEPARALS
jgi:hypothetical protein